MLPEKHEDCMKGVFSVMCELVVGQNRIQGTASGKMFSGVLFVWI